jgi:hypothetical protein
LIVASLYYKDYKAKNIKKNENNFWWWLGYSEGLIWSRKKKHNRYYKNLAEEEDGNTEITGTMALLGGLLTLTR